MDNLLYDEENEYIKNLFISAQSDSELVKYARENYIPVLLEDTERLLALLIKLKLPAKILEIGTAVGYSARVMLANAPADTVIDTIEIDEEIIKIAKQTLEKYMNRVNIIEGDALKILPTLNSKYDFIFLDGPKAQYVRYYPYLKSLLNSGGMIFADNVMMHGMVCGGVAFKHKKKYMVKKMREYLNKVIADIDLQTTVINVGDGIALSVKK
ncbi:MAG: class I SAM-dependent methyltransferase [Clostridia bacterium]|jgi:predicted O-methyltransferase YrrM|nr:class I SAM-dependent methyltransferase [Clostridia bacterium]MDD4275855.1 class I SAM-dependent methyltransferase [Clostridia bacterium]